MSDKIESLVVIDQPETVAKLPLTPEEEAVCLAFEDMGIQPETINIRKCRDIYQRLAATGDHFKDAYAMAKMMKVLIARPELQEKKAQSKIFESDILAGTLMHDIGKSGPVSCSRDAKKLIKVLFPVTSVPGVKPNTTIEDYLKMPEIWLELKLLFPDLSDAAVLNKAKHIIDIELGGLYARDEEGQTTDKIDPALNFFRRHADWTESIMLSIWKDQEYASITNDIIEVTSCHHVFDGRYPFNDIIFDSKNGRETPWEIRLFEFLEKYDKLQKKNELYVDLLTLLDKYQAFRVRSNMNHPKAISILHSAINNNTKLSPEEKAEYLFSLESLNQSQEQFDEIIKAMNPEEK